MSISRYISVVFLTLIIGCGPGERALSIDDLSGDPVTGELQYNDLCSRCHETNGRGGRGANLIEHRDGHDDAELIEYVLEGSGIMPSFSYLDDQVIADIIAHIRSL